MTKRIFWALCLVAAVVLLAGTGLTVCFLYSWSNVVQRGQLQEELALAAGGVETLGEAYLQALDTGSSRITWIGGDGSVRFDSISDPDSMENHADREEFQEALDTGFGQSVRYSDTLTERSLYSALRLYDGSVLRLSVQQDTVLQLVLELAWPILLVFAAAAVLTLFLAFRLSRTIMVPLNQLDLNDPLANRDYAELRPLLGRLHSQQEQLRRQEVFLRQQQEEFQAVTSNMQEGLVVLGRDRNIISINPAASALFGTDGIFAEKALLDRAYAGQAAKGKREKEGRIFQLDASPVRSGGTLTGMVVLSFDVTEREQAETMRKEFTANVSHELKTPLHIISGYAELMAGGLARQEDMPRFAGQIRTEAQRLVVLVEDILRLSQLDEGAEGYIREEADLYEIARQTVQRLQPEASAAGVSLLLSGRTARLSGLVPLLSAIASNLCDNAIKYNRPGGRVEVQVIPGEGEVTLTVVDTGIGIPREHQKRIFERFYRVDKSRSKAVGGTGLGLSIVKHAVSIHGGTINLESDADQGTKITVYLPV